ILIALSRPCQHRNLGAPRCLDKGGRAFPPPWQQKALRELHRVFNGKPNRHNGHLWPYVSIERDSKGRICTASVLNRDIPLTSVEEAFTGASSEFHIILSGPSVADIDYSL